MSNLEMLMKVVVGFVIAFGGITMLSNNFTLNGIKARTVGDGQHGTARWATTKEI